MITTLTTAASWVLDRDPTGLNQNITRLKIGYLVDGTRLAHTRMSETFFDRDVLFVARSVHRRESGRRMREGERSLKLESMQDPAMPGASGVLQTAHDMLGRRSDLLDQPKDDLRIMLESHGWPARTTRGLTLDLAGRAADGQPQDSAERLPDRPLVRMARHTLDLNGPPPFDRVHITWHPIWTGIGVNLAIYSLTLLTLSIVRLALVRAVRRRRGLCPRCKYNLNHDHAAGCPECGWNRPAPEAEHDLA